MSPPTRETKQQHFDSNTPPTAVSSPNSSTSSEKSVTNQNIIKKPKRLRKQLNNREFKKFYFELVPNNANEEANLACIQQDSYQVKQFETSHSKVEEIRNEIKKHSSHFYLHDKKAKKQSPSSEKSQAVTCRQPSPQTCQIIHTNQQLHSTTSTTCSAIQQVDEQISVLDSLLVNCQASLQNSHVNNTILDSNLMLTLDYEDIIEQLSNINSPYYQSFKQFNVK